MSTPASSGDNTENISNIPQEQLQGGLWEGLQNALECSYRSILRKLGDESLLARCFPEAYEQNKNAVKAMGKRFRKGPVFNSIKESVDSICEDQNIQEKLNALEKMEESSDPSKIAWRPSGNVQNDLRPHMYQEKLKKMEMLQKTLDQLEQEKARLLKEVTNMRPEFLHSYVEH